MVWSDLVSPQIILCPHWLAIAHLPFLAFPTLLKIMDAPNDQLSIAGIFLDIGDPPTHSCSAWVEPGLATLPSLVWSLLCLSLSPQFPYNHQHSSEVMLSSLQSPCLGMISSACLHPIPSIGQFIIIISPPSIMSSMKKNLALISLVFLPLKKHPSFIKSSMLVLSWYRPLHSTSYPLLSMK